MRAVSQPRTLTSTIADELVVILTMGERDARTHVRDSFQPGLLVERPGGLALSGPGKRHGEDLLPVATSHEHIQLGIERGADRGELKARLAVLVGGRGQGVRLIAESREVNTVKADVRFPSSSVGWGAFPLLQIGSKRDRPHKCGLSILLYLVGLEVRQPQQRESPHQHRT